jgi:hypothetical protein
MDRNLTTSRTLWSGALTVVFFALLVLSTGCKSPKNVVANSTPQEKNANHKQDIENFDEFYHKFHTDSVFQMSRIRFPLEGKMIDGQDEIAWTKENWIVMRTKIYDIDHNQYKTSFKKTETTFFQKFWLENSGLSADYRFELIGKKWYLVYALDQNL